MKRKSWITSSVAALILAAVFVVPVRAQDWDRAVSLFNQKQYRPAIVEFHSVLKAHPEYWQAWYYIGASHYQLKGYENSIDSFTNYVKGAKDDEKSQAAGYYFLGLSYYQLKKYDQAIPALAEYVSLSEKLKQKAEATARAALGRAYIFTDRFNDAIPELTAAAADMKDNANNYYYIGFANYRLDRREPAVSALNRALQIDPRDADSLALLGDIYLGQSKQNGAMAKQAITIGERLSAVRNDERTWVLLGQAYLMDKQYVKAAPLLEKVAQAQPESAGAWFNLGVALSRSDQWKRAADALERAVKLAPSNSAALLEMGYVYESDKQYDKALAAYEKAYESSGRRDETARTSIERVKQIMAPPQ